MSYWDTVIALFWINLDISLHTSQPHHQDNLTLRSVGSGSVSCAPPPPPHSQPAGVKTADVWLCLCVSMSVCMSVLDNEWKLLRPSTAGRRLRVSDVTGVLSAPLPFVNTQEGVFFTWTSVCCGGGAAAAVYGFLFFFHCLYCGHNHELFVSLMTTGLS